MASTVRALRRRRKMFAVATGAALTGATAFYSLAVAEPVSQDVPASCTIGTSKVDVTIPLTVDDLMDPVAAGGAESVVIKTDLPELPIEVTVQKLTVTIPIPGEIASVDAVNFSGGNMTGSYAVSGSDLVLTFTGPQSSSQLELPSVTADQTVKADIAPTTISWRTFSRAVADTNYGQAACTPNDPSQVINTTKVNAADAEPTPTTTDPTPTTAAPDPGTPTTEPTTPTTAPAPSSDADDPTVAVDVSVEADVPANPTAPSVPGVPSLPTPGGIPALPALPTPNVPKPTVPKPNVPKPTLPKPALPKPPALPAPTLPPVPAPSVPKLPTPPLPTPTLPTVPGLPAGPPAPPTIPALPGGGTGIGVDAHVGVHLPFL